MGSFVGGRPCSCGDFFIAGGCKVWSRNTWLSLVQLGSSPLVPSEGCFQGRWWVDEKRSNLNLRETWKELERTWLWCGGKPEFISSSSHDAITCITPYVRSHSSKGHLLPFAEFIVT